MTAPRHVDWGVLPFDEAHRRQLAARSEVLAGAPDVVFSVQHPPVVTGGRRASDDGLLEPRGALEARGVAVHRVERGGEWTYHGPGQAVIYPIVDLARRRLSVPCFVAGMIDVMTQTTLEIASECGVPAGVLRPARRVDAPGAWVVAAGVELKVGAVGVHVRRLVSMHGLALNVDTEPWGFDWVVPCGLRGDLTTSLVRLVRGGGGDPRAVPSVGEVADRMVGALPAAWDARAR